MVYPQRSVMEQAQAQDRERKIKFSLALSAAVVVVFPFFLLISSLAEFCEEVRQKNEGGPIEL